MKRTAEEFRLSAINNKIDCWPIHDCSLCGYECAYLFFQYIENDVVYDSGCDCTFQRVKHIRTWEDVAVQFNRQSHPDTIAKYNNFWKFNND